MRIINIFRRTFKRLFWVYVVLGVVLTFWIISFIPISLPVVRNLVCDKVSSALGARVQVGKLTITLFRSIVLQDVSLESYKFGANRADARIRKVRLDYRIMLFQPKKITANSCKIEDADIRLTLGPEEKRSVPARPFKFPEPEEMTEYLPLSILLEEVHLAGINCVVQKTGGAAVATVRGLEGKFYLDQMREKGISAWIDIDTAVGAGVWTLHDLKTRIKTERQAIHVELKKFALLGGHAKVDCEIRPAGKPAVKTRVEARKINLEDVYRMSGARSGRLTGTADLTVEVQSQNLSPLSPVGTGHLAASQVEMEKLPIQSLAVLQAFLPFLMRVAFTTATADFEILPDQIALSQAQAQGHPVDVQMAGRVKYNGILDLTADCFLPPELAATLPGMVSSALPNAPAGKKDLPLIINGTIRHPQVAIEPTVNRRLVRNTAVGVSDILWKNRDVLKQLFK